MVNPLNLFGYIYQIRHIIFLTIREVARICFVCLKGTSHGDVSFKYSEHMIWRKGRAYWSCFIVFLLSAREGRLIETFLWSTQSKRSDGK